MKKVLTSIITLAVLLVGGFFAWQFFKNQEPKPANPNPPVVKPKVEEPETLSKDTLEGAFNLLVIGSDSRKGQRYQDGVEGELNDVTMIVKINEDHTRADLISIPRDLIAPLSVCTTGEPGGDSRQFNEALGLGGPTCVLGASEELLGEKIQAYSVVNFDAVEGLTSAVGGVTVNIPEQIVDVNTGEVLFEPGETKLEGEEALSFVRERKGYGDGGDLGRITHQQLFIESFLKEFNVSDIMLNPVKFWKLADTVMSNLKLSDNLQSPQTILELANTVLAVGPENFKFHTLPTVTHPDNPNRLALDETGWKNMLLEINSPVDASNSKPAESTAENTDSNGNSSE